MNETWPIPVISPERTDLFPGIFTDNYSLLLCLISQHERDKSLLQFTDIRDGDREDLGDDFLAGFSPIGQGMIRFCRMGEQIVGHVEYMQHTDLESSDEFKLEVYRILERIVVHPSKTAATTLWLFALVLESALWRETDPPDGRGTEKCGNIMGYELGTTIGVAHFENQCLAN